MYEPCFCQTLSHVYYLTVSVAVVLFVLTDMEVVFLDKHLRATFTLSHVCVKTETTKCSYREEK